MCVHECRNVLLGHFDLDVDVVVSVAVPIHTGDSFTTQTNLLVRLNPWRNLEEEKKKNNIRVMCNAAINGKKQQLSTAF